MKHVDSIKTTTQEQFCLLYNSCEHFEGF